MIDNRKGAILIASLWILIILSILALGIGFRVSIEARLAKYNMDRLRALYLAKAGVVKSIYRLSKYPAACDSIYECGTAFSFEEKSDQGKINAIFNEPVPGGFFSVAYKEGGIIYPGMSDEERKININTASENVLKNILVYAGEEPTIASSIVQWRSQGPGLDDGYYEALPGPYKCKHERFSAPEELLLVKGVTRKIFDKVSPYITVFGNPDPAKFAVNINTAPKPVLSALIMADASPNAPIDKTSAEIYADRIITSRNGNDGRSGTKDDAPTTDIYAMLKYALQNDTQAANLTKDFTTSSKYFRIESQGMIDKTKVGTRIVCIVQKDQGKAPVLKSYREY